MALCSPRIVLPGPDSGVLDVGDVRLDVSGMDLLFDGDLMRYGPSLMMSDAMGDGDWFPLTMASRSWAVAPSVLVRCCL